MIHQPGFPCVAAKSALATGNMKIEIAASIESPQDDRWIHQLLCRWSEARLSNSQALHSFAVVFAGPRNLNEGGFEAALWDRLNGLSALDRALGFTHDPMVSADPRDPSFAVSFGGRAYFVIGLHPNASRRARRTPSPAIVFNLHDQFAQLRKNQKYERMREVIVARDAAFDGSPNPMLARHGEVSEASQYSGRVVGQDWVCPFEPWRGSS